MARVYATAEQLADYPGGDAVSAGDGVRLLGLASKVVDLLLAGVTYDVDRLTLLPTDPDVAASLTEATCAIAVEAHQAGVLEAGSSREWGSVSIGNVSLSNPLSNDESPTVLGIPVPVAARVALSDVGPFTVTTL